MQTELTYRTNRDLFSNYYLDEHLPETEEWDEISEDELREAYEEINELWNREKGTAPKRNESQLEEKFIRPMFRKLGIPFEVEESTSRTQRRPDYGFFESEKAARGAFERREEGGDFYKDTVAVADAKRWGRPLDTRGSGEHKRDFENPSYQIHVYLQETSARWAILTDGQKWRLYYGPTSHRLDSYYEIDLPTVLEKGDLEDFKYFYLFFRHEAFLEDASGDSFLDDVYGESNVFAQELGEDLQDNIYDAIKVLSEGFLQYPENNLDEGDLDRIHDSSLIYLYRLIFVLYAESEGRDLLNTDNDIYKQSYSLNSLKQEIAEELDSADPKYRNWQDNLWSRLGELFKLIDQGSQSRGIPEEDLYIPAYNGGLFRTNPDATDSQEALFLANHEVGDAYLARVIELLTRSQSEGGKIFVDYSSLDVRHLGSIYEGLLEYQLNVADEPLTLDDGEYVIPDEGDEILVEVGEVYLTTGSGERKATGSYYTPEYVVEYIVDNTLGPLVGDIREDLVGQSARGDERGFADKFADRVFDLKVLDPAMGSGHFLTNAVDYLAREIIDAQEKQAAQQGVETVDEERDINWARRQVAQRCIYGVDLNPLATELAKVSLWLRTLAAEQPLAFLDHHLKTGNSLVGSDIEDVLDNGDGGARTDDGQLTLEQSFAHTRQQALEHVMDRFQDLLAIDNETLADAKEMEDVYDEVREDPLYRHLLAMANVHTAAEFGLDVPSDADKRMAEALRSDSWDDIEGQDWYRSAQAMAKDQNFFHWELEFPIAFYEQDGARKKDGGFDAVIGNPPYIRIQELQGRNPKQAEYLLNEYESAVKSFDIYVSFTEKGHTLLREGGLLGYIEPHKFFQSDFGEGLRGYIANDQALREVLSFGRHQVFEGVSVYTCVLILQRGGCEEFRYSKIDPEILIQGEEWSTHSMDATYTEEPWVFQSPETLQVLESIENAGPPLEEITSKIYQGVVTSADDIYLVDVLESYGEYVLVENGKGKRVELESELVQPFLKGQDVKRYAPLDPPQQIVLPYNIFDERSPEFIEEGVLSRKYPNIHSYFKSYESELRDRDGGSMDSPRWYDLTRNQNMIEFSKSKLITPEISYGSNFTHDSEGVFHKSKVYGIIFEDKWDELRTALLGALNSSLLWFYLRNTGYVLRGGYFTFKTDYLNPFCVPEKQRFNSKTNRKVFRQELSSYVTTQIETRRERQSLNLDLFDYLGIPSDELPDSKAGETLEEIQMPVAGVADTLLTETEEEYEGLRIEGVTFDDDGGRLVLSVDLSYKVDENDPRETDRWDRLAESEFETYEAMAFVGLSETEETLLREFVPVAVEKAEGFAGFRQDATKTNSPLNRLKILTLPDVDEIQAGLEQYIEVRDRADELDAKIEKTDQLIDEIVYDLYDLTDEEIEIVKSAVADD
ncbi:Eco57I restriction-modification methylase [Halalkalicoccus paucihalophilus]|uniref:site-specific DNA-methyltransferase (adenine-specific) n=1 Tax=Halalkalicoccus paucihalophilus TaxID=1008153 RepID=A0A151A7N0_9EURY|nr:Eco57I restriction-modification methylase domain-containing protein [Halalkalicoccus paucihalophilus]KYH23706.1 Eco57I restriction-modification methylase [Halalkalicoccus paucihalophilus]